MADLNIKVGADTGEAVSALDKLKTKLAESKENVELMKEELKDLNKSLSNNDRAIAAVNKQLAGLNTSTKDIFVWLPMKLRISSLLAIALLIYCSLTGLGFIEM